MALNNQNRHQKIRLLILEGNRYEAYQEILKIKKENSIDVELLWYMAWAIDNEEERQDILRKVANGSDRVLAKRARVVLERESELTLPPTRIERWWETVKANWLTIAFVFAIFIVFIPLMLMIIFSDNEANPATSATSTPSPTVASTPTTTPLPGNMYTITYPEGSLTVRRVDRNRQIVTIRDGAPVAPVANAEFIGIQLSFRCGQLLTVCTRPPEAALGLKVSGVQNPAEQITELGVANERLLQSTAAGTTTEGWIVFSVPRGAVIEALWVYPASANFDEEPLVLELMN